MNFNCNINKNIGRKSQGMVELVLILPLLIVMLLGIFEYSIFQRNVSAVQDIASEAATAASKYYVDENKEIVQNSDYSWGENIAVEAARQIAQKRLVTLGIPTNVGLIAINPGSAFGIRPFALYRFESYKKVEYKGTIQPLVSFDVDYRDPKGKGVSTQLVYHYNLILFGVSFHLPGGRKVVIIPNNIRISSTQTRQCVYY